MDIARMAMNNSQSALMGQVGMKVLGMSLDTIEQNGEQIASMLADLPSAAPAGVMNSEHIDVLV